jgi:RNA polymerase sigma factor (sigma-70 family)
LTNRDVADEHARSANPIGADAAPDRDLMQRVQSGDEAALGVLMARWELPVKSVIARLVFNASEAEELAQETFVRVWQQREKFRVGAEFRPWIFAIAVNLARNRRRWWRRRPTVELYEWSGSETIGDARQETGRGLVEKAERAAAVRDAIAALPADLREALVLFEYEQMSQGEIAVAVGATVKAVETRIHRAREKLRAALARWM